MTWQTDTVIKIDIQHELCERMLSENAKLSLFFMQTHKVGVLTDLLVPPTEC